MSDTRLKPGYVTVRFEYGRVVGPRSIHGGVTLSFEPADTFTFASTVEWPSRDNYEHAVRRGIEAAFLESDGGLPASRVTLTGIVWNDLASCEAGFQAAARIATSAALET